MVSGGPTHVAISPTRAAGCPPMSTVALPSVMGPPTWGMGGSPGVTMGQTCISPSLAAGWPHINTVGNPTTIEPPWAVISPILAAGFDMEEYLPLQR